MGLNWAEHTVEIDAPIETCFDAIIDYETLPLLAGRRRRHRGARLGRAGPGQAGSPVHRRQGPQGRLHARLPLRRAERIEWDFVEGNGINDADGHYLFEELGGRPHARDLQARPRGRHPAPRAGRAARTPLDPEGLGRGSEARGRAARGLGLPGTPGRSASGSARASSPSRSGSRGPNARSAPPPAPEPPDDWGSDGSHSVAELPGLLVGEAASIGRRVADGGARTARELSEGAASAGAGAARRAVGAGREVAGAMRSRASRLLGRGRTDHYPR